MKRRRRRARKNPLSGVEEIALVVGGLAVGGLLLYYIAIQQAGNAALKAS